jgi:hypothetical protein
MLYYDERGYFLTESELHKSFAELKANDETDCETYAEYVRECCGKNGTLEKVKEE